MRWGASAIVRVAQSRISWVVVRYLATSFQANIGMGFASGRTVNLESTNTACRIENGMASQIGESCMPVFVSIFVW